MDKTISLLVLLLVFAVLIQFLVNRIKTILGEKVMSYVPADVIAALLGILFAFMFKIDVFVYFGLTATIPFVGYIISGLIISAGAPAVHELLSNIREQRKALEQSIPIEVIENKENGDG